MPPKLLACIGFLYKVVHKIGRLRKFNRSREIEFNVLRPAGGDPGLDHLQKKFFDSLYFLEWTWPF